MIHTFGHELVYFVKLARETINQFFLLIAHLICSQVAHVFDIFLQLCSELAKEFVRASDLVLQVFFRATNCVKDLSTELMKVVFKTEEVTLHVLELLFVRLEVSLLLLGNFFTEIDLAEGIRELLCEAIVGLFLSLLHGLALL